MAGALRAVSKPPPFHFNNSSLVSRNSTGRLFHVCSRHLTCFDFCFVCVRGSDVESIGNAEIKGGPNGVLMRITISEGGLTPGWHGLHMHQVGDCSDLGVFKKSGGHVGKLEGGHGLLNPLGPEGGDIPNIFAHADGSAGYEAFTSLTSMTDLFDEDGAAIIIHTNPDDHLTQPIGGAGARVACAEIQ